MSFSAIRGYRVRVPREAPFPDPDPAREVPRRDFPPWGAGAPDASLARVLDHLTVADVTAVWYRCRPGWTLAERRVPDDMFLYVAHGELDITVENRPALVRRGAAAHFRRGLRHQAAARPGRPLEIVSVHYTATVFDSLSLPALLDFPDVFDFRADPTVRPLLADACREFLHRPAGYRRALESTVTRLLFHVIRTRLAGRPQLLAMQAPGALRRLLPALETMRRELAAPVAMTALARRCGLSDSQFRRVFRAVMGRLPVQYQRQLRMERACQLLRQTDLTVAAVAAAVGYAEPAFFAHSFRRLVGLPPGRYRRQADV